MYPAWVKNPIPVNKQRGEQSVKAIFYKTYIF